MKNSNHYIHLLPVPIVGCLVAPTAESWETTLIIIARLWINLIAIDLLVRVIKLALLNTLNWNQFFILINHRINIAVVTAILLKYFEKDLINEYTLPLTTAYCIFNFFEMEEREEVSKEIKSIGYGEGMACSFFEGYLTLILPNDGSKFYGFEENINIYESKHGVRFPVKKLFLIITKSLYSPPSLKEFKTFNKRPFIRECKSLEELMRDVAGVKNRIYKNSAYMIERPGPLEPVFVAAECATPLHTLHKVKERRAMYKELADADFDVIADDFCRMLESILDNSRECRGKCVLVKFDDTNPEENLAEVLLKKIQEIEPNFEDLLQVNRDKF